MKKELINLAECLAQDQKFVEEFSKKKTVDEQYAFAQTKVKGYSKDEFIEFMKNLEEAYRLRNELSPEDLESASGGSVGMVKLAALSMLGLTFAGGAMNMATSLPTAAVKTATVNAQDRFRTNIDDIAQYNYVNSSEKGTLRETLKSIFNENQRGCESVINDMCDARKGLQFNRHTPKWGVGSTCWSMEMASELPEIFSSSFEIVEQEQAKHVLQWISGKYLYFYSDEDFQMQCSDGSYKNINYELFKSEIKGDIPANESVFNKTIDLVKCLLNRDRALSGALRELGKIDLATKVMGNRDISLSGVRDMKSLLDYSTFGYTNSSSSGELRNKLYDVLKNEETKDKSLSDVRENFTNSPLRFSHHPGRTYTSWSFIVNKEAENVKEKSFANWLQGKELWYKNESELKVKEGGWKVVNYDNFLNSIRTTDKMAYDEWTKLNTMDGKNLFNGILNKYENELNKARAVRGALESLQGQQNLINLVMPDTDI